MPTPSPQMARRLRTAREDQRMSQRTLSAVSGVTVTTISRTETAATVPSLPTLTALARALGLDVAELLNGAH